MIITTACVTIGSSNEESQCVSAKEVRSSRASFFSKSDVKEYISFEETYKDDRDKEYLAQIKLRDDQIQRYQKLFERTEESRKQKEQSEKEKIDKERAEQKKVDDEIKAKAEAYFQQQAKAYNIDIGSYKVNDSHVNEAVDAINKSTDHSVQVSMPSGPTNFRLSFCNDDVELRIRKINKYIEGTPIANCGAVIVKAGLAFDIDPYFLTAISRTESTFGKFTPADAPLNCWGIKDFTQGYEDGYLDFKSYEEGYQYLARLLSGYIDRGLTTIPQIGALYCETSTWPNNNMNWMREIESIVF